MTSRESAPLPRDVTQAIRGEHYPADAVAKAWPLIAARVLSEAADAWQSGEWANAPRRADRVQERIANGQHVTQWLRARAATQTEENE